MYLTFTKAKGTAPAFQGRDESFRDKFKLVSICSEALVVDKLSEITGLGFFLDFRFEIID